MLCEDRAGEARQELPSPACLQKKAAGCVHRSSGQADQLSKSRLPFYNSLRFLPKELQAVYTAVRGKLHLLSKSRLPFHISLRLLP